MSKMLVGAFCVLTALSLMVTSAVAEDTPAIAEKLVNQVTGDFQKPDWYTTKHGFMNDAELLSDNGGPLEEGLYIMSWLALSPPIVLGAGGGVASMGKDLLKEAFGSSENDVTKDPKLWPIAGMKGKGFEGISADGVQWIPINFQDLVDAGEGNLFASGNEFDWLSWGGQGLNQFHEYIFCLVMWDQAQTVAFAAGSDDPHATWINGEKLLEGLADRNWAADTEKGETQVPDGEWVPILVEVGENGGECGYTLEVNPPPDDHTLDTETALAVSARGKLATLWAGVKASH